MTDLAKELIHRFGEKNVREVTVSEDEMPLLRIDLNILNNSYSVLMTNGLSDIFMSVPEPEKGKEHNELYFCLPSYWDLDAIENPNMNWVFYWIQRLCRHIKEKNSWFGPGHTMACGVPFQNLSELMKCNHFFLNNPMLLKEELVPASINGKTIYFLAIIPIFEDEMDYKQGKGTQKLIKKLEGNGISEKLDDFRCTVLRSKWRFVK
jgi:hypothetical protein